MVSPLGVLWVKNQETFPGCNRQNFAISANKVRNRSAGLQVQRHGKLKRIERSKSAGETMLTKQALGLLEVTNKEANGQRSLVCHVCKEPAAERVKIDRRDRSCSHFAGKCRDDFESRESGNKQRLRWVIPRRSTSAELTSGW